MHPRGTRRVAGRSVGTRDGVPGVCGTLGIVDVGTHSIHLVIGRVTPGGGFRVLVRKRGLVRLGEGGLRNNVLTAQAMRRAEAVLRRYAALLAQRGVDRLEAVATSAVRQADNGRRFVARIRERLGLSLRIISGREEARLIALGVWRAVGFQQRAVMIAIGGGSAQVMCGSRARLMYAASVPLGAARLTERFIRHDPAQGSEVAALTAFLRRAWAPVARAVRRRRWERAFGSSAGIGFLAAASIPGARDGARAALLTQARLRRLAGWLAGSTAGERRRVRGFDPGRQDVMLAAALTLLTWMDACGVTRLASVPGSLRDGLVVDYLRGRQRGSP